MWDHEFYNRGPTSASCVKCRCMSAYELFVAIDGRDVGERGEAMGARGVVDHVVY